MSRIVLSPKAAKLMKLCELEGYKRLYDLLKACTADSVCPAAGDDVCGLLADPGALPAPKLDNPLGGATGGLAPRAQLADLARSSFRASRAPEEDKVRWLGEIDAWLGTMGS